MNDGRPHTDSGRRAVRAWCLYDWANSVFATSVVAAILPAWFAATAGRAMPAHVATAWWGYASAGAMLVSALSGALLGAASDRLGRRKPLMLTLVIVGAAATVLLALVPAGAWIPLLLLFMVAFVAFASANVLYDSLLPGIAPAGQLHRVSARGFAYGYLGGGILLAVHLVWILAPARFGLRDADAAVRLAFVSVGVWWLLFSIPLFRSVPEPAPVAGAAAPGGASELARLAATFRNIRRSPDLLRFLIAYWIYSDGIGTVIRMATVYGAEIGLSRSHLIGALLMIQLVAAPASLAFAALARRTGPQLGVALGLGGYVAITVLAYFVSRPWHFWAIAAVVALVQGGTQALSRSMFSALAPRRQIGAMFGFYSVSEKVAGALGPLLFGLVAQLAGSGRVAVFTLIPFFVVGGALLLTTDLGRGARRAAQLDTEVPA